MADLAYDVLLETGVRIQPPGLAPSVITARELMAKAERAAASAKLLLDAGDADGACNRAY